MISLAVCFNSSMAVQDNWLANVKALVSANTPSGAKNNRAGYRAVAAAAGLDEEYIYQLYTGRKKTVGPDAARAIARAFADGRDLSWIDLAPDALSPEIDGRHLQAAYQAQDAHEADLLMAYRRLPSDMQKEIVHDIMRLALTHETPEAKAFFEKWSLDRPASAEQVAHINNAPNTPPAPRGARLSKNKTAKPPAKG